MSKKHLVLAFCIIFINCKKQEGQTIGYNNLEKEKSKEMAEIIDPIFMGLSPKMSDKVFFKKIENLNEKGKLDNNKFILPIDNENFDFEIEKTSNSIRLNSSNVYPGVALSQKGSEEYFKENDFKKESLIKIFKTKYKLSNVQIPNKIDLRKYGLDKQNYILFKDKNKFILLGYTILKSRIVLTEKEKKENYNKLKKQHPNNVLVEMTEFENQDDTGVNYLGMQIEINYYHIEAMDSLLEKFKKDSEDVKEKENETLKMKLKKKKQESNNLQEI